MKGKIIAGKVGEISFKRHCDRVMMLKMAETRQEASINKKLKINQSINKSINQSTNQTIHDLPLSKNGEIGWF